MTSQAAPAPPANKLWYVLGRLEEKGKVDTDE